MKQLTIYGGINRMANASDGYVRYPVSRATVQAMLDLLQEGKAKELEVILAKCLSERGVDRRTK